MAGAAHAGHVVLDAAADLDLGAGIGMGRRLGQHVIELAAGIAGEKSGRGVGRDARRADNKTKSNSHTLSSPSDADTESKNDGDR